jgi:uncharacterized protein (DUF433 family)
MVITVKRPSFAGVYPVLNAALYIQATTPTNPQNPIAISTRQLCRWVREGMAGEYLLGLRGREVALTFLDLVSFRLISIFRAHGIPPKEIRSVHDSLRNARGWSYPFAMEPVWMYGPNLLVKENGRSVAVSRGWQAALDFVDEYMVSAHDLLFDLDQRALLWEPAKGIVLDPRIMFGEPCIKGTRISTEVIWALHAAGDPKDRIAESYGLPVEVVEAAIDWETRITIIAR